MLVTASHQSGQDVQVSFDKEALKAISKVANHPSLSNEANWRMVSVVFKHASSGKRLVSGFKNNFTKTDNVKVKSNMSSGEVYELHQILISGNGRVPMLSIKRSEITNASSMDLTLNGGSQQPQQTYSNWSSYMYSPYTNDPNILSVHTLNALGGIYGGSPSLPDWVKTSNITFGANESGSVIFKLGNAAMENMAFGLGITNGEFLNVGMVFLNGALRPNSYGDVPDVPQVLSSPENICKIEKVGSTEFKLYVNGALLYIINNLRPTSSWTINCRPAGSGAPNGILSSYKEI
jgi:hypothetical protein